MYIRVCTELKLIRVVSWMLSAKDHEINYCDLFVISGVWKYWGFDYCASQTCSSCWPICTSPYPIDTPWRSIRQRVSNVIISQLQLLFKWMLNIHRAKHKFQYLPCMATFSSSWSSLIFPIQKNAKKNILSDIHWCREGVRGGSGGSTDTPKENS